MSWTNKPEVVDELWNIHGIVSSSQTYRESGNISRAPVDVSKRATPVARLKRRILQRRRGGGSPVPNPSQNGKTDTEKKFPESHAEITPLTQRPVTPSDERSANVQTEGMSHRNFAILPQNGLPDKRAEDRLPKRAVTPQPKQRQGPQSYLDRWRAAQLQQRPCTAQGLLSQMGNNEAKELNSSTDRLPKRAVTPQPKQRQGPQSYLDRWRAAQLQQRPCTAQGLLSQMGNNEAKELNSSTDTSAIFREPDLPRMKLNGLQMAYPGSINTIRSHSRQGTLTQPEKPSVQQWHPISSRHMSPCDIVNVPVRPVTSMGNLTLKDNSPRSKKSVQFQLETPLSSSLCEPYLLRERPKTPGAPEMSRERAWTPSRFREMGPRTAAPDELSGTNNISLKLPGSFHNGVCSTEKGSTKAAVSHQEDVFSEISINNRPKSAHPSTTRRVVIARSRDVKPRTLPSEAVTPAQETVVPLSREPQGREPPNMTSRSEKLSSVLRKKVANIVPRIIRLPRSFTPQPRQPHNHRVDDKPAPNTAPNTARVLKGHKPLMKEGSSGFSKIWRDEIRGTDNCVSEASDTSAPVIRRGKSVPGTPLVMTPASTLIQESGTEEGCDKEHHILSWLGECQESSLPAYLPVLTADNQGALS